MSSPVRLGPFELANPWILAPMAGVSDMPFRAIARELGAALCPTELVSAAGLVHASARTRRYLRHAEGERPFMVQLFGGDPAQMEQAAALARAAGADILDVNMGCPVPKVTRNGAGSALLCDPSRAASIVRAVRTAGLPVTAKIRAGWDRASVNAVEVALALQEAGAAAVAIHPRTRAQGYTGAADWRLIAAVKAALRIPVIGNGDVRTPADARRMRAETGCDAVMIGRAALGNPWIFRELSGGEPPSATERRDLVARHLREQVALVGDERHAVRQFRKQLLWYAHGLRGASAFRARAVQLEQAGEVLEAAAAFFAGEGAVREPGAGEPELDLRGALG
ncbi:MAG: tRNA dihydrouridine synthase DusB [Myxococcales bacterium]